MVESIAACFSILSQLGQFNFKRDPIRNLHISSHLEVNSCCMYLYFTKEYFPSFLSALHLHQRLHHALLSSFTSLMSLFQNWSQVDATCAHLSLPSSHSRTVNPILITTHLLCAVVFTELNIMIMYASWHVFFLLTNGCWHVLFIWGRILQIDLKANCEIKKVWYSASNRLLLFLFISMFMPVIRFKFEKEVGILFISMFMENW